MKRSSIVWIVVFVLSVSMVAMAAQRGGGGGGGGRGGGGGGGGNQRGGGNPRGGNPRGGDAQGTDGANPRNGRGLPPEGSTREDVLRVANKARPMLELVELLQRRTGRPISYEDPLWAFEGIKEKGADGKITERPGDIKRVEAFKGATGVAAKDTLSLTPGSYDLRLVVDARSHLLAEPIDSSLRAVFDAALADYASKKLPGLYTYLYMGNVEEDGFGWVIAPSEFKDREGRPVVARRVLDYPISFPVAERPTLATFQLIAELATKASGQQVQFKKLKSEANMTGRVTETVPVELPAKQFVRIGATNETARSVIAKALRTIERGDPRIAAPIPQRAWRLLYSIEKQAYFLDLVEVRQEGYKVDGTSTGSRVVNWRSSPTPAATAAGVASAAPEEK